MRIAVVGAGAVGSTYGALLARAGHAVALVDLWAEHVDAIRRRGLELRPPSGDATTIAVAATTDAAASADAEAVLVLTKAFSTEGAARSLEPHLGADAVAVTLQNGLGNDRVLAAVLGRERVVAGSTTVGAEVIGPGCVQPAPSVLAGASLTSLGAPAAGSRARRRVEELASALASAGLPAEVREDVDFVIWRKLAMTASIGPLCAVLRCTVADALASSARRVALRRMFDEIIDVAAVCGVELDAGEIWEHALETWRGIGPHRPSIAIDLLAGRRTEIDVLSGAVAALAAERGASADAAELVHALLRSADAGARVNEARMAADAGL